MNLSLANFPGTPHHRHSTTLTHPSPRSFLMIVATVDNGIQSSGVGRGRSRRWCHTSSRWPTMIAHRQTPTSWQPTLSSAPPPTTNTVPWSLSIRRITFRPRLNPLTESTLQSDLLSSSLKREQHSSVRNKISGAVWELAVVGELPEHVPFFLHRVFSVDSRFI